MDTSIDLKELKVFTINYLRRLKKRQEEALNQIQLERSQDDLLTIKEVVDEFKISSKTIHRWKNKGLQVYQRGYKGKITIKRSDLENYIKKGHYGRFN